MKTITIMKKLTKYCSHLLTLILLLATSSCAKQESSNLEGVTDKMPENVRLATYSNSRITVAWDRVVGATSYTVQLLGSKDSDSPIDAYTTTSKDSYDFDGLEDSRNYYVRVRANVDFATGNWVYIMNRSQPARIILKYGIVDEDFVEPEPEPELRIYPNFPEGWENHDGPRRKTSHGGDGPTGRLSDVFPSGEWLMTNMYTHSGSNLVHKNGTWGLLMAASVEAYLEMDFDLPNGATKFSFVCGTATHSNANDNAVNTNPITVKVEYSQDQGDTWIQLGDNILVNDRDVQYFTEYNDLDIQGPVRFRIGQDASAARLLVDDIAVYYWD